VTVEDDGHGLLDGPGMGNGLSTMRERAEELGGTFAVVTTPRGVRVTAVLPARPATFAVSAS
jgi:signal transduction histidine kinase